MKIKRRERRKKINKIFLIIKMPQCTTFECNLI